MPYLTTTTDVAHPHDTAKHGQDEASGAPKAAKHTFISKLRESQAQAQKERAAAAAMGWNNKRGLEKLATSTPVPLTRTVDVVHVMKTSTPQRDATPKGNSSFLSPGAKRPVPITAQTSSGLGRSQDTLNSLGYKSPPSTRSHMNGHGTPTKTGPSSSSSSSGGPIASSFSQPSHQGITPPHRPSHITCLHSVEHGSGGSGRQYSEMMAGLESRANVIPGLLGVVATPPRPQQLRSLMALAAERGYEVAENERAVLQDEVQRLKWQCHTQQEALEAKNLELCQLHMELQDLHASNDAVSVTAVAVNKALSHALVGQFAAIHQSETDKYTQDCERAAITQSVQQLADEHERLRQDMLDKEEEVAALQARLLASEDMAAAAVMKANAAVAAYASTFEQDAPLATQQSQVLEFQQELELQQELQALQAAAASIKAAQEDACANEAQLLARITHLEAERQSLRSAYAEVQASRLYDQTVADETASLREQLSLAHEAAVALHLQHAKQLEAANIAASSATSRVEALQSELKVTRKQLRALQAAQAAAVPAAAAADAEASERMRRVRDAQVACLKQEVDVRASQIGDMEAEMRLLRMQVAENLHLRTLVRQLQSQLSPTAVAAASAAAASGSSPAIRPPRPNTLPSPLRASSNPAANTGGEQALASVACNLNSLLVAPEKAPRKQEQAQKDKPKRFRLLRWTLGTGLRVAKLSASALGLYVASLLVAEKIHPAQLAPGKQIIDQVKKVTAKPVKVVQRVVRQAARARHLSAAGSSLVDVQNTSVLTSAPEQSTAADHDVLLAPETGCCTC